MDRRKILKYGKLINFWPPFFGAGIYVKKIRNEGRTYDVEMKLRWYNRNIYGTHFGGSLFAMADPFYVFAAFSYFGDDYILWDKSASIEFVSPGKSKVKATFEIPLEKLAEMKQEVDREGKKTFTFRTDILDMEDKVVAKVDKVIYIRKKRRS